MDTVTGADGKVEVALTQLSDILSVGSSLDDEEFVSYSMCWQVLAQYCADDNELSCRAGKLWGALCRLGKSQRVCLKGRCLECESDLAEPGIRQDKNSRKDKSCHHYSTKYGWRRVEITRASIVDNFTAITGIRHQTIGMRTKADYLCY